MKTILEAFTLIAKHWPLVELLITAIEDHGVDPARARQMIEDEMTMKANDDMRRELEK